MPVGQGIFRWQGSGYVDVVNILLKQRPERRQPSEESITPIFSVVFLSLLILITSALIFYRAMSQPFSHDEHQFVASATLFAESAYLPYKDFPHHHMPYQVFFYGFLFKFTQFHLLAARAFSALCAVLSTGILAILAYRNFRHRSWAIRNLFVAMIVVLLLTTPLYYRTSGKAWNHDLPTLLVLIALLIFDQGSRKERPEWWFFTGGILLGIATGTRLTYVFTLIPFLAMIFLFPYNKSNPSKLKSMLFFTVGVGLALLPAFILFLLAPEGFYFGNYVYPRLHTTYQTLQRVNEGMTFGGKIAHFVSSIITVPLNFFPFAGYMLLMLYLGRINEIDKIAKFELASVGTLVVSLLLGAFAPTPSLTHYFYSPVPFIVLGVLLGVARVNKIGKKTLGLMLFVVIFATSWHSFTTSEFKDIKHLFEPDTWVPIKVHKLGNEVSSIVDGNLVLTLAPLIPMEGDAEVYIQFTAGPFTWRVASLLSEERQQRYGVISTESLENLLEDSPPRGILVGFERGTEGFNAEDPGGLEQPLEDYAIEHGYVPQFLATDLLSNEIVLWVR